MNEEYTKWLTNIKNEEHLKLLNSYGSEYINNVFNSELEFGTGGVRGIMGIGPSLLNEYTIKKITNGLGKYLLSKKDNNVVVIGHDCRNNSRFFTYVAATALINLGIKVYIFDELTPTPVLSYMVRKLNCDSGIMITASHNPKEYNGYKVYDNSGSQLNLEDASNVINYVNKEEFDFTPYDSSKEDSINIIDEKLIKEYIDLISTNKEDKNLNIVFTSLHGTSYKLGLDVLNNSGYKNVKTVENQMTPDGDFINTKSANPEEIVAFEEAIKVLKENDYDIALATDPDADRIGLVVKEGNDIRAYTGNETGSLLIKYLVDTKKYNDKSIIYKTIVTGEMGAKIASNVGIKVEETLTGFKFIGEKIRLENDYKFLMGYEESYGYLFNEIVRDKDAISSIVQISDMVNYYKNNNKKISEVLKEIYDEVGFYTEITFSYTVKDLSINDKVMSKYRNYKKDTIFGLTIDNTIDYENDDTGLPKADVIKFYIKDKGWIVFRPSGTEPKIKMYVSVKGSDSKEIAQECDLLFKEILNSI